ncbi:hypothetical protein PBY51_013823 [Eleginops maclovinus]|uniref:Uncharacterized protein n=1 Tax=Eleginops maclovinus TaxID=56733 RepID=A0AAN7Y940_ELEMC|nr:hypothetical protein PBY51_013823 [Eleginops maclovinus]
MSERRGGRERRIRNKRTEPQTLRYLNRQGKHRRPHRDSLPALTCSGRCRPSEEPDSRSVEWLSLYKNINNTERERSAVAGACPPSCERSGAQTAAVAQRGGRS